MDALGPGTITVQSPPPHQPVLALLNEIASGKDIDSLGLFAPRTTCATADGIVRVAEPYLPGATIAVGGSNGFVGSGVVLADDYQHRRADVDALLSTTHPRSQS